MQRRQRRARRGSAGRSSEAGKSGCRRAGAAARSEPPAPGARRRGLLRPPLPPPPAAEPAGLAPTAPASRARGGLGRRVLTRAGGRRREAPDLEAAARGASGSPGDAERRGRATPAPREPANKDPFVPARPSPRETGVPWVWCSQSEGGDRSPQVTGLELARRGGMGARLRERRRPGSRGGGPFPVHTPL